VIDALKVDRIHLEGQSLGGWVAALFALKYPEKIERLILTTPMGYEPDPGTVEGYKQPDWAKLRDSNLATLADPNLANIRERMKRIIHNENTLTDEAVAVRHRIYNDPAVNAVQRKLMEAYFSGGIPEKFALRNSVIKNIKPQTLVYWGDKNITPVAVGRQMAANIPGARFHSAPETGHWAQFENSGEHNRVVLDFLTEGRAAAAS
jgi:2-hydroxy-6-oxonona-2,4-dienedioate hydrolase